MAPAIWSKYRMDELCSLSKDSWRGRGLPLWAAGEGVATRVKACTRKRAVVGQGGLNLMGHKAFNKVVDIVTGPKWNGGRRRRQEDENIR